MNLAIFFSRKKNSADDVVRKMNDVIASDVISFVFESIKLAAKTKIIQVIKAGI